MNVETTCPACQETSRTRAAGLGRVRRLLFCLALLAGLSTAMLGAQQTEPAPGSPQPSPSSPQPAQSSPPDPDAGQIVGDAPAPPRTPEQLRAEAWKRLENAANDSKHSDTRIQALAALGLLGNDPRAVKLIQNGMVDSDVDVRTAAVLAAGQNKSINLTTDLRRLLDDKEPQVAFSAALTLWRLHDYSGEDILIAVAGGDRAATPGAVASARHTMSRDLHHPATLARIGATQGAGLLLGPFGFGLTAAEYLRRNGGNASRVEAIEAIAQNRTGPIRAELIAALKDKDLGVRAAAAKALADYHEPAVSEALAGDFEDPKPPVRLTVAAAYLSSSSPAAQVAVPAARPSVRRR